MFEPKRIAKFAGLSFLFLVLLLYPWSGWEARYASLFRAGANVVFQQFWFWPQASAKFLDLNAADLQEQALAAASPLVPNKGRLPLEKPDGVKDTLVLLKNVDPTKPGLGQTRTTSRLIGYWPTAFTVALVLATSMKWWRKIIALIAGLFLVNCFIAVRVSVMLLKAGFADPAHRARIFQPSDSWKDVLRGLDEVIADNPTFNFVAPVFIWLVAVFFAHLFGRRKTEAQQVAASS